MKTTQTTTNAPGSVEPVQPSPTADGSSAPPTPAINAPDDAQRLHELRQRLVQLLIARAQSQTDNRTSAVPSVQALAESDVAAKAEPGTNDDSSNHPSALLTDLRDLLKRFVVLPDMVAETLALWIVHTYAFTLRDVTTYIGVVSPEKRCGKTTLLELLARLANRARPATNISPPALFRVIQETQPTLIIDEADTFLHGRDEMAGILNAGYRKSNSYVVRVAEGKKSGSTNFVEYSCWCPKVMAAIGHLPDTLADRCIVITMQRKMHGEECERMRHFDGAKYRQRCADFVAAHSGAIAQARPEIPATLNDRAADIWEPLLAIADLAGGDWPALARQAAEKLSGSADDEITLLGYFLRDLRSLMLLKKVDRMLSRDIVAILNPMHDRPWEDLRRGREINEWWLGRKISELGIRSKYIRLGETVGRGYLLHDIEPAHRRYVPNSEPPDVSARTTQSA